jgi:ABC-type Fe3+-hydroxamate transport system substrate-binding protein
MEQIFSDQMGRTIRLDKIAQRIVSIVPSQTEYLFDLGLDKEVVGITKFCVHPDEWYRSKKRVGGTKQLNIEAIRELQPDLIIGNKEENSIQDILELEKIDPVWMSDIYSIDDALNMMLEIGKITNTFDHAQNIVLKVREGFQSLKRDQIERTFLYFIWKDPDYLAGKQTFIHAVLEAAGFVNHCRESRYPEWSTRFGEPDVVFLSSEPYPFKAEHIELFKERFPGSEILMIDGEMCSWYGSRMLKSIEYLKDLQNSLMRIS